MAQKTKGNSINYRLSGLKKIFVGVPLAGTRFMVYLSDRVPTRGTPTKAVKNMLKPMVNPISDEIK